jgi:hypothetical protein
MGEAVEDWTTVGCSARVAMLRRGRRFEGNQNNPRTMVMMEGRIVSL